MYHYTTKNIQVNPALRLAWATLLDTYQWSWFATLTFAGSPKTWTALNNARKWLKAIQIDENITLPYYLALEYSRVANKPHIHLLMANLQGVSRKKWWFAWYTSYGYARILPYRSEKGASYYISKYVVKDTLGYGMFELALKAEPLMSSCELCGSQVYQGYLAMDRKLGRSYIVCKECSKAPGLDLKK